MEENVETKYKVDKGVTKFEFLGHIYPFNYLGVSDSFFVPIEEGEKASKVMKMIKLHAKYFTEAKKRLNEIVKYSSKIRSENGVEGIRTWRDK